MLEVIGFEGFADDDEPVAWGAAALQDGSTLINPVTGASVSMREWGGLVDQKHVTNVQPFGPLPEYARSSPCYVLRAYRGCPEAVILVACHDREKDPVTTMWGHRQWLYWLFPSLEGLQVFGSKMAVFIRKYADKGVPATDLEEQKRLARSIRILDQPERD